MNVVIAGPIVSPDHMHPGHPERPPRVDAAAAGVDDLHLGSDRVDAAPRTATFDELAVVHDPSVSARARIVLRGRRRQARS
jgi:acetoin utilization deacetylase AcuC-like enzyme